MANSASSKRTPVPGVRRSCEHSPQLDRPAAGAVPRPRQLRHTSARPASADPGDACLRPSVCSPRAGGLTANQPGPFPGPTTSAPRAPRCWSEARERSTGAGRRGNNPRRRGRFLTPAGHRAARADRPPKTTNLNRADRALTSAGPGRTRTTRLHPPTRIAPPAVLRRYRITRRWVRHPPAPTTAQACRSGGVLLSEAGPESLNAANTPCCPMPDALFTARAAGRAGPFTPRTRAAPSGSRLLALLIVAALVRAWSTPTLPEPGRTQPERFFSVPLGRPPTLGRVLLGLGRGPGSFRRPALAHLRPARTKARLGARWRFPWPTCRIPRLNEALATRRLTLVARVGGSTRRGGLQEGRGRSPYRGDAAGEARLRTWPPTRRCASWTNRTWQHDGRVALAIGSQTTKTFTDLHRTHRGRAWRTTRRNVHPRQIGSARERARPCSPCSAAARR